MMFRILALCGILLASTVLACAQPALEQKAPTEQFRRALQERKLDEVKRLLAADPTLATAVLPNDNNYPIFYALQGDGTELLELLLAAGADVNTRNSEGGHPLQAAASNNNVPAGRLLLAKGAAIDYRDHTGMSALLQAAANGGDRFVEMLLAKGASPAIKDRMGHSFLQFAAQGRNLKIILTALAKGGDVKAVDKNGDTVLHAMLQNVENGDDISYGSGREHANADEKANEYSTALDALSETERDAFVTDVGPAAKDLTTALLTLLLKRGADVNAADEAGRTPLLDAALQGNLDAVKFLLDKGAKLDVVSDSGMTPAWAAAASGNLALLQFFADKGCPLTAALDDGSNLLHAAARAQSKEEVTLLLAKGIALDALDDADQTPLFDAISNSQNNGGDEGGVDTGAAIVSLLLEHKCKVTLQDNQGNTPLHMAISNEHVTIVPLLVAKGAKLDVKNNEGQTPLQLIEKLDDAKARAAMKKAVGKG